MKDISEQTSPEDTSPSPPEKKKKSPLQRWILIANLMTIPALSFYFYVGLDGKINGYFILLILMIVAEYLVTRRYYKD